jgi:hypothetical protein
MLVLVLDVTDDVPEVREVQASDEVGVLRAEKLRRQLVELVLPALHPAVGSDRARQAQLRLNLLAAAVALHRERNGRLPEKLDDLVPGILPSLPADPMTGKAFLYKSGPEGAYVWSVGKDLEDNGGSPPDPVTGGEAADLVSPRIPAVKK